MTPRSDRVGLRANAATENPGREKGFPLQDVLNLLPEGLSLEDFTPPSEALALAMLPAGKPLVESLRATHHLLARTLAEGKDEVAAAASCGVSLGRLRRLKEDPAFRELLAYYEAQHKELFEGIQDRLTALGLTFLDILQDRALDTPEKFTNRELLDIMNSLADRSFAPTKGGGKPLGAPAGGIAISINFVDPKHDGATLEARVVNDDPLQSL